MRGSMLRYCWGQATRSSWRWWQQPSNSSRVIRINERRGSARLDSLTTRIWMFGNAQMASTFIARR